MLDNEEFLEALALLNTECFSNKDHYSEVCNLLRYKHLENGSWEAITEGSRVLAYVLARVTDEGYISETRLGVTKDHRHSGLGIKLVRRLFRIADKNQREVRTYASIENINSINLHIKAGMKVTSIDEKWIYLTYIPKKKGS